ncbi:MAG: CHRD domain-containing protein [Gemmatimonadetes bacterium]|nr:CHRD domain-containing protein [Gemmatimonadota bacterium]
MSRALSAVIVSGLVVACTSGARDATGPFEVPVFSHASNAAENANGGNFGTPLSGDEEVPARPTQARGSAIFQLNAEGDALTYQLMVANIENVFQAHIHRGAVGANGGIVVWLYPSTAPVAGPLGQGRIDGVIAEGTITAATLVGTLAGEPLSALLVELMTGNAYVNVHTNDGVGATNTGPGDFPGGEIRGQVEHRGH